MIMNTHTPKVTVLVPVYNQERFLKEAIESILNQSFINFELLIINDGSTDKSKEIIDGFKKNDNRILLINNDCNLGLTKSLNKGLDIARGEYVARMDGDDVSHPERLLKQVDFLDFHKEVGVVGAYVKSINCDGKETGSWIYPRKSTEIKWNFMFSNVLAHPSVMFRRKLVLSLNGYNKEFISSQDYDLWVRLSEITQIQQLNNFLVSWRTNPGSITITKHESQIRKRLSILQRQAEKYLKRTVSYDQLNQLYRLEVEKPVSGREWVRKTYEFIESIHQGFLRDNPNVTASNSNAWVFSKLLKFTLVNLKRYPLDCIFIFSKSFHYFSFKALFDNSLYKMLIRVILGPGGIKLIRQIKSNFIKKRLLGQVYD